MRIAFGAFLDLWAHVPRRVCERSNGAEAEVRLVEVRCADDQCAELPNVLARLRGELPDTGVRSPGAQPLREAVETE
jgi:hypothetical protein